MPDFCECQECGFVVRAAGPTAPVPKNWDACPNCGGAEFAFRDGSGFEFEFPDL